jgi:DNA-binding transcriptional ArsR family regulator
MTSERPPANPGEHPTGERAEGTQPMTSRTITDARAMRALAHPVRIALIEALVHAGTLTATQASQVLGESPANCAFHLRTLAKYGYVEEAGGGRGRERPWRRVNESLRITDEHEDPQAAIAAGELEKFFLDTVVERARTSLTQQSHWPAEWRNQGLGMEESMIYLTPGEARRLREDTAQLLEPYLDRSADPRKRPPGTMPLEVIRLSYPLLHLAEQRAATDGGEDETAPGQRPG